MEMFELCKGTPFPVGDGTSRGPCHLFFQMRGEQCQTDLLVSAGWLLFFFFFLLCLMLKGLCCLIFLRKDSLPQT